MNWVNELPAILLILIITGFFFWSSNKEKGFFCELYKWVPPILLLYLLPTIAVNTGIVKPGNQIRVLAMNTILPMSLIMLTAIIHVPDLLRLTRKGLLVFLIGTFGIVIGGPLALLIMGWFQPEMLHQQGADAPWRGLGRIPRSGLRLKPDYGDFDAVPKYGLDLKAEEGDLPGCRCGEILRGLVAPPDCRLYAKTCKPDSPHGPCMVSFEGACFVHFKYRNVAHG